MTLKDSGSAKLRIAVIGDGVAGATVAETLSRARDAVDITVIEKSRFIAQGPPFCHLHAGGFLYALRIPLGNADSSDVIIQ